MPDVETDLLDTIVHEALAIPQPNPHTQRLLQAARLLRDLKNERDTVVPKTSKK